MDKFMPPEITYFERMIKTSRSASRKSKQPRPSATAPLSHLREDLQYALVMGTRNSNALVGLIERVSKEEEQLIRKAKLPSKHNSFEEKLLRSKRSQSLQLRRNEKQPSNDNAHCFSNTLELVFSVRKKECVSRLRRNPEVDIKEEITSRINRIHLRTFDTE